MADSLGLRAAAAVDGDRLWSRLAALAKLGATPAGGVNRQALTSTDGDARSLLARWAHSRGFSVGVDEIGNLFVRRAGLVPELEPILTGSHLDTQPAGGRFDGAFGVVAGFEVLEALEDAGAATRRPIEVVAWTNEEGCRFQPGCMGSAVFAGSVPLPHALAAKDEHGVTVAAALAALPPTPGTRNEPLMRPVAAYVEAHIEQGPLLETQGRTIGVVTGIHGTRWYAVEVEGEAAHAGTTPMSGRRDALDGALRIIAAMSSAAKHDHASLRFTVGRVHVWPNSPNTIPGRVAFSVDLRSADEALLERVSSRFVALCDELAPPCRATVRETFRSSPQPFDPGVQRLIGEAAKALRYPALELASGAFHDALFLARHCRTGMIFVPCAKGLSHNEAEDADPADLTAGTRTLADVVCTLANEV